MSAFTIYDIDLSLAEQKTLALLQEGIISYVRERSKVSSQHKLPTMDEIADTRFVAILVIGRRPSVLAILKAVLDQLVKDERLIQYDCYYSTEPKEIL